MAIDRTNKKSQYYKLDTTTMTDEALEASQSGGIGVGAKIKSLSTGDFENGVDATVVNAYDIDWKGYKVNGNDIKSTGALIEEIEKGAHTDEVVENLYTSFGTLANAMERQKTEIENLKANDGFDCPSIETGYNAAMKSSANPNTVLTTKRGQFISGYGNTSKNSGTITSGMNNINGMNMGIVLGRDNNTDSASTQGGVCSCVIGGYNKLNVTKSTSTYDFIQGRKNTLTSVNGNNVMFGQYSSVNGSVNRDLGGENSSIVGEYNSIISPCADRIVYTFTKQSDGVYKVNAKPNYIEGEVLLSGFPIMLSSAIDTELITNYTAEKIEGDNDHILLKTSANITTYLAVVVNSVKANKTIVGNGFADADKAIALGLNSLASGEGSVAIGEGTRTTKANEVALGAYNNSGTDTLFSVGNGNKNSLHNIFEITTDGKVKVNGSELGTGGGNSTPLTKSSVNSALNSSNINVDIKTNDDVVESINTFYGYYSDAIEDKLKKPRATTNEGCVPVSRGGEDRQVTWKNLTDEVTDVINNNMVVLSNAEYEALGSNLQNNVTYFIYD